MTWILIWLAITVIGTAGLCVMYADARWEGFLPDFMEDIKMHRFYMFSLAAFMVGLIGTGWSAGGMLAAAVPMIVVSILAGWRAKVVKAQAMQGLPWIILCGVTFVIAATLVVLDFFYRVYSG